MGTVSDGVVLSAWAQALVDASALVGLGVVITREDDTIRVVNRPARELLDCDEGVLGRSLWEWFPETDTPRLRQWRGERHEGRGVPRISATPRAEAAEALRLSVRPLQLDGALGSAFVLVRGRDKIVSALARSEARFRHLIEAAPEAIGVGRRHGIAYANRAMLDVLGYLEADELRNTHFSDYIHPDDVAMARESLQRVFDGGPWGPPLELRVRRPDERVIAVEFLGMRITWDAEPATLVIGRDLSERRTLQAQLIQADRFSAVGTLAAGVAHEINNPLSYVLLNLEYLVKELPRVGEDPKARERLLERLLEARHGAERVRAIAEDLEAFSHREEPSALGPVDVTKVVRHAMRMVSHEVQKYGALVDETVAVPRILGEAARLEQVLANLLVNAAQALPDEDGKPRAGARVTVRTSAEPPWVVVEVSDTGAGIPADLLDRVFDPFFTTKPVGVGTGLGLPICHSIVTSLGGDISVQSDTGRGSTFRVRLPEATEEPAEARVGKTVPPTRATGRTRILVVDDEAQVATLLSRVLEQEHDVEVRTNAQSALQRLLDEPEVHIVLCDLLMPNMSGMDLYQQLTQLRPGLEKRMVFMTGGAFTPRAADFLRRVEAAQLMKPFDLDEVRRVVAEVRASTEARSGRK